MDLGLEERVSVEEFQQLMEVFARRGTHRHSQGSTQLRLEEFQQALAFLLGRDAEDERVALLSAKVRVSQTSSCYHHPPSAMLLSALT